MKKEIRKIRQSFSFAMHGIVMCVKHERNLRIHLCIALYVFTLGIMGGVSGAGLAVLSTCFAVVMCAELLNTAIERLCDAAVDRYDQLIRLAKDISAGAVLIAAGFSALSGGIIFFRKSVINRLIESFYNHPFVFILLLAGIALSLWFINGIRGKQ